MLVIMNQDRRPSVCYLGCWCLLFQPRSHCDHKSHNPDPEDPPAPVYWPVGPTSLLQGEKRPKSFRIANVWFKF